MNLLNFTEIAAICAIVGFVGKLTAASLKGLYTFAKTWEEIRMAVKQMGEELKGISTLLQDGQRWMSTSDERFKEIKLTDEHQDTELASLRSDVDRHGELIANIQGRLP